MHKRRSLLGVPLEEGLGFTDVATLKGLGLVLEDGHRREHAAKPEPSVEGLLAWDGVQDDLLVTFRQGHKLGDDFLAYASTLVGGQYRYIAEVRTVCSVGECSSGTDDSTLLQRKAAEAAVREDGFEARGGLVAKGSRVIERLEFRPVDAVDGMRPSDGQR